jgi:undecaprenyl-diphosphatase
METPPIPYRLTFDDRLFLSINHLPHSVFWDSAAGFLSGIGQWGAIWLFIAIILFFREEKRDHWFFLPSFLALSFSWTLSELLLKWVVARPRPTDLIGAIVLTNPGNYSFPSTHATIAWAMAFVLSREEPRLRVWFYLLAFFISLSRIYLGVHYPSDILGGAILGLGIGWLAIQIEKRVRRT